MAQIRKIKVPTPQNVDLKLEPASIGDRIVANILDSLIIFGLLIGVNLLFDSFINTVNELWTIFFSILALTPYLFYHLFSEIMFQGQSIGKKQSKIKVIRLDGTQATLGNYMIRWLIRPIDMFFVGIIAIITISINNKGQRLGDIASGTTVVKLRPTLDLNKILVYEFLDDHHYKVCYSQAILLSEEEVEDIKLLIRKKSQQVSTQDLEKLAQRYRKQLGIHSQEPPYIFLKTLVKDFTYLSTQSQLA